jgi:hypothetical protein
MDHKLLRLVYVAEYLLALIAVFTVWSEVGVQTHLDLMAWYIKLFLGPAIAYAVVRATMTAVADERAWNGRTLRWVGIMLLLSAMAGLMSYYSHLYEPSDEDEQSPATESKAGQRRAEQELRLRIVPEAAQDVAAVCQQSFVGGKNLERDGAVVFRRLERP